MIFDSANQVLGFVEENRVYDAKGNFVTDVRPEITIKEIKNRLLNERVKGVLV